MSKILVLGRTIDMGGTEVAMAALLQKLVEKGELMSYRHTGFWQCMDTAREKELLETLWANGTAPWKVWD